MTDIIKGYRNMIGKKQAEMAELMGISRQAYWNKEIGRTAFNDNEKERFRDEVRKVLPNVSVDDIFLIKKLGNDSC